MVVVTISMVLMGGAAITISQYFAKERIATATTDMISILNTARSLAITNQVPASFTGLDYVAVTLSTTGQITVYPVNIATGVGNTYLTKDLGNQGIVFSRIDLGGLQFASGNGKLMGKNPSPSFVSYPLPSNSMVGVTVSSSEISGSRQVIINAYGAVTFTEL